MHTIIEVVISCGKRINFLVFLRKYAPPLFVDHRSKFKVISMFALWLMSVISLAYCKVCFGGVENQRDSSNCFRKVGFCRESQSGFCYYARVCDV